MKFIADITYDDVTPESAEHGEFSDQGYLEEDREFEDLRELIEFMKREGYMYTSESPVRENCSDHMWFSTNTFTQDYTKGIERTENIHIRTSGRNKFRIAKLLKLI